MDNLVLEKALESNTEDISPFRTRNVIKLKDQASGGNYSSGTSVFETITLSNGGKWCDYSEAYLTIPVVTVLTGLQTGSEVVNFTADHIKDSDFAIGFKNSNLNLINSCMIEYGNRQLVQATDHINDILIFEQHMTMSEQDELLHGPTIGYAKDSAESWRYDDVNGIVNNNGSNLPFVNVVKNACSNEGYHKRLQEFDSFDNSVPNGHEAIFGNVDVLKKNNGNYIENFPTHKVYYKNAIIRLKDLPVFKNCSSLMKGANFKITLTLNQCMFKFSTHASDRGKMSFEPSSFNGKQTNPVMVSCDESQVVSASDDTTSIGNLDGGSATLPQDSVYTVSCSVGRCQYSPHNLLNPTPACQETNIELNIPVYDLKASEERRLLEQGQKRVVYNEVLSYVQLNKSGAFNDLITNGVSHAKRMIVCPFMSASENGTNMVSPHTSPFDTSPSTCSPYMIENLQIQVANQNVYHTPINYSYEQFLSEMAGKYGVESGMMTGLSSSRINMRDFINTYGYIVVDLKRKASEDESVSLSVQMSGRITSSKKLDFYIFIETEKSFSYDVASGQRLS